jgi:hypothetical protein
MTDLDLRIVESLRSAYDRLMSRGDLLSTDRLQASYAAFRARFGPDALRSLDGTPPHSNVPPPDLASSPSVCGRPL